MTILSDFSFLNNQNLVQSVKKFYPLKFIVNGMNRCYETSRNKSINYFDDILDEIKQPTPVKTIFFHETTCSKTGIINLNSK